MFEIEQNLLVRMQKELAEALASYKREHMAHSVTLQSLADTNASAIWWQNQFNAEQTARFELLKIINPV